MDKYISVSKLKAKVISGEPILFDEATQHEIFFLLELEPSEDVKPVVHAHWMMTCDTLKKCSNCGYDFAPTSLQHYCPCCGAKMDAYGMKQSVKGETDDEP